MVRIKKISDSFLSMIAILMTTYYVPALAKAEDKTQINLEAIYLAKHNTLIFYHSA